ncbi:hypothetical protein BGW37DRAFT_559307 [Umbelopsis sp. PMI_123]|nr:hypothetical protein BGW37DRAFT_559307 [Umbelopsis sp. PMI_123]
MEAVQIKWVSTQTDNVQLYSEATGNPNGPAIVFVHGFAQAGLAFDHQFYDHDLTTYNSGTKWGQDFQSVIHAWNLKNVSLVGWSYGGIVISEYVRVASQENIANMIYVDASTSIGIPGPSTLNPNYTAILPSFVSSDYQTRMMGFKNFTAMVIKTPLSQDNYMKALGWSNETCLLARNT